MRPSETADLSRLNDIVVPDDVSMWPLAPGWYGLFALLLSVLIWNGWKRWRLWRANAYRRAALRELEPLTDTAAIVELLRRTALIVWPRSFIAEQIGFQWAKQIEGRFDEKMPEIVRQLLATGAYRSEAISVVEVSQLKNYAKAWILGHRD